MVIHNQVFPIDRVRKDRLKARFVWKRGRCQEALIELSLVPIGNLAGFRRPKLASAPLVEVAMLTPGGGCTHSSEPKLPA